MCRPSLFWVLKINAVVNGWINIPLVADPERGDGDQHEIYFIVDRIEFDKK